MVWSSSIPPGFELVPRPAAAPNSGCFSRLFRRPRLKKKLESRVEAKARFYCEPHDRSRDLARYILSRRGYQVIEADCAATALVLWESGASVADLLLTDLTLPGGKGGAALADRLRSENPASR